MTVLKLAHAVIHNMAMPETRASTVKRVDKQCRLSLLCMLYQLPQDNPFHI